MSNRFHSKWHRTNHHTYTSDTNPDAGYDPIASPDSPFQGDFVVSGAITATAPNSAFAGSFNSNNTGITVNGGQIGGYFRSPNNGIETYGDDIGIYARSTNGVGICTDSNDVGVCTIGDSVGLISNSLNNIGIYSQGGNTGIISYGGTLGTYTSGTNSGLYSYSSNVAISALSIGGRNNGGIGVKSYSDDTGMSTYGDNVGISISSPLIGANVYGGNAGIYVNGSVGYYAISSDTGKNYFGGQTDIGGIFSTITDAHIGGNLVVDNNLTVNGTLIQSLVGSYISGNYIVLKNNAATATLCAVQTDNNTPIAILQYDNNIPTFFVQEKKIGILTNTPNVSGLSINGDLSSNGISNFGNVNVGNNIDLISNSTGVLDDIQINRTSTNPIGVKIINPSSSTTGSAAIQLSSNITDFRIQAINGTANIATKTNNSLNLGAYSNRSSYTDSITISGNGFVGIKKSNPNYQLDVSGDINTSGFLNVSNGLSSTKEIVGYGSNVNSSQFRAIGGTYGSLIINDGTDTSIRLTNNNDAYGNPNSLEPLAIDNATGNISFANGNFNINHDTSNVSVAGQISAQSFWCNGVILPNLDLAFKTWNGFKEYDNFVGSTSYYRTNSFLSKENTLYVTGLCDAQGKRNLGFGSGNYTSGNFKQTQINLNNGEFIVKFYMAYSSMYALTNQGNLYALGANDFGQLGINQTTTPPNWTKITFPAGAGNITYFSCSNAQSLSAHCIAIDSNNKVYGWGYNRYYNLGLGTSSMAVIQPTLIPTNLITGSPTIVKAYACGDDSGIGGYTFLIDNSNIVYAAGYGQSGQLGVGSNYITTHKYTTNPYCVPSFVKLTYQNNSPVLANKISSKTTGGIGTSHILYNNLVYTCGDNKYGSFGNNTTNLNSGANSQSLSSNKTLSAAYFASFYFKNYVATTFSDIFTFDIQNSSIIAIQTSSGIAWSWGGPNTYGALGNNNVAIQTIPYNTGITGITKVLAIDNNTSTSYLFNKNTNTLYSAGYNNTGQLGNGYSGLYNGANYLYQNTFKTIYYNRNIITIQDFDVWGTNEGTGFTITDQYGYLWSSGYMNDGSTGVIGLNTSLNSGVLSLLTKAHIN
jgi:alpha-tubulin suppressor-like RCC1 family protein